jgi:hypothetical protein
MKHICFIHHNKEKYTVLAPVLQREYGASQGSSVYFFMIRYP